VQDHALEIYALTAFSQMDNEGTQFEKRTQNDSRKGGGRFRGVVNYVRRKSSGREKRISGPELDRNLQIISQTTRIKTKDSQTDPHIVD